MTEILERDLATQEQIDNAHDANFRETLERLGKIPDPIVLEFKDGKGLSTVIKEQIIYPYYKNLGLDDSAKTDYLLVKKIINKLVTYNIIKSADDVITNGETIKVKRKIIKEAVQEYIQEKNSQSSNGPETTKEGIPPVIPYTVKKGDGYYKIIKEEIFKNYYKDLYKSCDKELLDAIVIVIEKDTGIKNEKLKEGQKLTIHTENIKTTINNYLNNNGGNNGHETAPQQQVQPQTQPQQQPQTPEQGQSIEQTTEHIPSEITYVVKKGDTIDGIVKNEIYKYYKKLDEYDKKNGKLLLKLRNALIEQNHNTTELTTGKWTINMVPLTNIVQKYLKDIETVGGDITLSSMEEFNTSDDELINRLRNDNSEEGKIFQKRLEKVFDKKQTVRIPKYIEHRKMKPMSLEEIIEPKQNEMIDNSLQGKTFILDPGHGFNDTGAMGIVQDGVGNTKNNVVVFESAIAMDVTYRTAKLLRQHGATVELTHYIPTRGISDVEDLPPCLGIDDKQGRSNGLFQDKRDGQEENVSPQPSASLTSRRNISNRYESNKGDKMFISLHANALEKVKGSGDMITTGDVGTYYIHPEKKDESGAYKPGSDESGKYARYLMGPNGIGEFTRGKNGERINKEGYQQGAHNDNARTGVVNNKNHNPAILVEMFNINNNEQANQYRNPSIRQQKAKQLVDATINYYKK